MSATHDNGAYVQLWKVSLYRDDSVSTVVSLRYCDGCGSNFTIPEVYA